MKQGFKKGNEWTREIRMKIQESDKKIKEIEKKKEARTNYIFKKSTTKQYLDEEQEDLEVPIDGDL